MSSIQPKLFCCAKSGTLPSCPLLALLFVGLSCWYVLALIFTVSHLLLLCYACQLVNINFRFFQLVNLYWRRPALLVDADLEHTTALGHTARMRDAAFTARMRANLAKVAGIRTLLDSLLLGGQEVPHERSFAVRAPSSCRTQMWPSFAPGPASHLCIADGREEESVHRLPCPPVRDIRHAEAP